MWSRKKKAPPAASELEPVAEHAAEGAAAAGAAAARRAAEDQRSGRDSPVSDRSRRSSRASERSRRSSRASGQSVDIPGTTPSSTRSTPKSGMPQARSKARSISPASPGKNTAQFESLSFAADLMAARALRKKRAQGDDRSPSPPPRPPEPLADTSGEQLKELLAGALAEPEEVEDKKGPVQILKETVDSLQISMRVNRCLHSLRGCPASVAAWVRRKSLAFDESVYQWQQSRLRRRVKEEFIRMAVETGDLPPSALPTRFGGVKMPEEYLERLRFSPPYVVEAFHRVRPVPKKPFIERALDGEIPLNDLLGIAISTVVLVALVALFFYLGLASAIFSNQDVSSDAASGAIVDSATGLSAVGAAASVGLKPLWDYASLSLDDLRRVEDVLFVHNQATHMLRVASVARTASGSVLLKAVDSSVIRVEPGGRSYWRRAGHAEVYLQAMETWRATRSNPEVAWLTSGVLSSQVAIPV